MPEKSSSNFDIFLLLSESGEKAKKKQRTELLSSLGIKEFFPEGSISIDKRTCWGVECKLCIKACPTNALYWKTGEVGITDDLCVYCGACVLSCMVDDCIKIERKREDGTTERFSKPRAFVKLAEKINAKKRLRRVSELFPTVERYLEKYKTQK
ncbi:MAG: 4Fe-4S dicluster domain-containing protein [Candidatus Bathyarchaeota archaeon]|nr:4Fe-4S dicluster domain-containing protein [Candidatus Bathyarchaeota archaeon]